MVSLHKSIMNRIKPKNGRFSRRAIEIRRSEKNELPGMLCELSRRNHSLETKEIKKRKYKLTRSKTPLPIPSQIKFLFSNKARQQSLKKLQKIVHPQELLKEEEKLNVGMRPLEQANNSSKLEEQVVPVIKVEGDKEPLDREKIETLKEVDKLIEQEIIPQDARSLNTSKSADRIGTFLKSNMEENSIEIPPIPPELLETDNVELIQKAREERKQLNTLDLQVCEISCKNNHFPIASSNLGSAVKDSLSENCVLKDTEKIRNEEQEDKIQTNSNCKIEQNPFTPPKDKEDNLKSVPNEEVQNAQKNETLLFIFDESGLKKQVRLTRFRTKIVRHVRNASLNNHGNSKEEIVCRTMSAREHLETPEMESKRFRNNKIDPSDDSDNGERADSSLLIGKEKFLERKEGLTAAQQFIGQAIKSLEIKNSQQIKDKNKEESKQNQRQITQKKKTEVILPFSENDSILPSKQKSFSIMPQPTPWQHVENATLSEISCPRSQLNELSKIQYKSERSNLQEQPLLQHKSKRENDKKMHNDKIILKDYLNKESPQNVKGEALIKKIPLFEPDFSLQEDQGSALAARDLVKNTENSQEKMKIPYRLKSLNHNNIIDLGPVQRFNRFQAKPQVPDPQRKRKIGQYLRAVPRTKIPNIDPIQTKRNCTFIDSSQGSYNMQSQHRATPQQIIRPIEPKTCQKYSAMSDKRKPIKKMRPRPKHVVVYNQDSPSNPKINKPPFFKITSPEEEKQASFDHSQLTTPEHPMARELLVNDKAHIDWARSMLFWNVKNGIVNFNNDRDSEVFYDFEINSIENNLKNLKPEALSALHSKARNTLKKLTSELLVGHIFYNFDGPHATPTVANIMAFFSKCREFFKTRKALIPIFILINERDNLVTRDIFKLINLSYIDDTQKNYLKSLVSSLHHSTHKILKKVQKFRDDNSLFDEDFVVNRYNYVQVCQVELDDILQIMEKKFGFRPGSSHQ